MEKLEAEIRKSERKRESQDCVRKQKHKFSKTIYEEQYDLNMEIYNKLEQATNIEVLKKKSTFLMKYGVNYSAEQGVSPDGQVWLGNSHVL